LARVNHEVSQNYQNYIFREFECRLSVEEKAELCFKSVRTVKEWDRGRPIPRECKRLMRYRSRIELSYLDDWSRFRMRFDKLERPSGQTVTPQEIITAVALLEIQSKLEVETSTKILKFVRAMASIKSKRI